MLDGLGNGSPTGYPGCCCFLFILSACWWPVAWYGALLAFGHPQAMAGPVGSGQGRENPGQAQVGWSGWIRGRSVGAGLLLFTGDERLLALVERRCPLVLDGFRCARRSFSLKPVRSRGTWALFSILLSIGILLHLFRNGLNFHPKGRLLKNARVALIVQNFVLGISVFLQEPPLHQFPRTDTKRIGVIVFFWCSSSSGWSRCSRCHRLRHFPPGQVNSWAHVRDAGRGDWLIGTA